MKIFKITDDIYHAKIFVIDKTNNDELIKYFNKKYQYKYEPENGFDAIHYRIENKARGVRHNYIIFLSKFKKTSEGVGILTHELMHLLHDVMGHVGVKYCEESEEAYAYYFDYLIEKILNKLLRR
jgi:hypothetical protein